MDALLLHHTSRPQKSKQQKSISLHLDNNYTRRNHVTVLEFWDLLNAFKGTRRLHSKSQLILSISSLSTGAATQPILLALNSVADSYVPTPGAVFTQVEKSRVGKEEPAFQLSESCALMADQNCVCTFSYFCKHFLLWLRYFLGI